jgi:methionyl-tRNA synthetase
LQTFFEENNYKETMLTSTYENSYNTYNELNLTMFNIIKFLNQENEEEKELFITLSAFKEFFRAIIFHHPVKKVSLFLRNWNASWMPSYRLQSASVLRRFYMGLPLLEAIDLTIDFQKGGNYHNPTSQTILNYLFCL